MNLGDITKDIITLVNFTTISIKKSVFIEVKQGPYIPKEDKILFKSKKLN